MNDEPGSEDGVPDLELTIGSGAVGLGHLVSATSTFAQLIAEVTREYAGSGTALEWTVEVKPGSVRLPLRGRPTAKGVPQKAAHDVADLVGNGVETLEHRAERPPYFSDRAVTLTRALANLASDDLPLLVRNGHANPIAFSKRVLAHADALLGPVQSSYGTIEGRLEALNIRGPRPAFAIFEPLTGNRVECYFGESVGLDEVLAAVGRRVGVRGTIRSRRSGARVSVDVDELRQLREQADLPPASTARGILRAAV